MAFWFLVHMAFFLIVCAFRKGSFSCSFTQCSVESLGPNLISGVSILLFFLSYEVKCNRILFFHFLFLVNMPAVSRRESCSIVTSSLNFIGFTPNFSGTFHVLPCYQNQESWSLGGHHCKCPTFLGIRGWEESIDTIIIMMLTYAVMIILIWCFEM